jgi:hypothetical protein
MLDAGMQNVAAIPELLKPYDPRSMRACPMSARINHVENDDEECSRLVEIADAHPSPILSAVETSLSLVG